MKRLILMTMMLGSSAYAYNAVDPNLQSTESSSFASDWNSRVKGASIEQVAQVPSFTPSSFDQNESVYGLAGAIRPMGNEDVSQERMPADTDKIK